MNELKGHWDHSTKPSQFCVKRGKEEIYRGGYNQGYEILMNSKTPETNDLARGNHVVPTEWAEQLERERDEAREYADKLAEGLPDGMLPKDVEVLRESNLGLAVELTAVTEQRDEWAKLCGQYKQERDEAREELHDIKLNLGDDAEGCTLLHAVCALQNERDEARAQLTMQDCKNEN